MFVCVNKYAATNVIRKSLKLNIGRGECAGVGVRGVGWPTWAGQCQMGSAKFPRGVLA